MNILKFGLGDQRYNTDRLLRTFLSQWRGRPSGQLAGTFASEMADLRKMLFLCDGCVNKFDVRRNRYRRPARPPLNKGCIADCDGCRSPMVDCHYLIPEERLAKESLIIGAS